MKSPLCKYIGICTWFITALASLNIGTSVAFGFDIFKTQFLMTKMPWLVTPAYYLIGISGLISLAMFFMGLFWGCKCAHKSCPHCGSGQQRAAAPPPFGA